MSVSTPHGALALFVWVIDEPRPGLDPRIQDVVLLAPNFTTNPYDPLFFSGKLG